MMQFRHIIIKRKHIFPELFYVQEFYAFEPQFKKNAIYCLIYTIVLWYQILLDTLYLTSLFLYHMFCAVIVVWCVVNSLYKGVDLK